MSNEFFADDLKTMNFLGEVIENSDPEKLGRIKVKVFGKFDTLATEYIPWAYPANQFTGGSASGSGSFSVPKKQSIVNVYFDNGNIYNPIYTYIQKPSEELKTEIGEDTENFHSLLYDTEIENGLKIYYSQNAEKGLFINLKNTLINIRNDNEIKITNPNGDLITLKNDGTLEINTTSSITVNTQDAIINAENSCEINTSECNINASDKAVITTPNAVIDSGRIDLGENASQKLVLGDLFMQLFNSHTHSGVGNLGYTIMTTAPLIKMSSTQLSRISKTK